MEKKEKIRIAVRADGDDGKEAGMGHIYRSLAYTKLLLSKRNDLSVSFIMRDIPEGIAKVTESDFEVVVIPRIPTISDYDNVLSSLCPDLLIIDILGSSNDLMISANRFARQIVSFDDLNDSAVYADIIINGILWATRMLPERFGRAKVYQGVEYLTLRDEFADINKHPRVLNQSINSILISTGGADGRGFTMQLANILRDIPFVTDILITVGPAFPVDFISKAGKDSKFHFLRDIKNMSSYYLRSDLALITGGTVMFEAAACGTPSVVISSYENMVPQVNWFGEKQAIINAGFYPGLLDADAIKSKILMLNDNYELRCQMSSSSKKLVDGKGLFRVVEILESSLNC